MTFRTTQLAALALALVIPASQATATSVILEFPDITVTSIDQEVVVGEGTDTFTGVNIDGLGSYEIASSFSGATLAPGDVLRQTIRAVTGKVFQITPGYNSIEAGATWGDGSSSIFTTTTVTFNGLSGGALSAPGRNSGIGGWVGFPTDDFSEATELVTFESLTVEMVVPESVTIGSLTLEEFAFQSSQFGVDSTRYLDLVDAGNPAVPEPSSIALLLMGGVGLGGYGWRKRRQG